jgi:hypothetical protein
VEADFDQGFDPKSRQSPGPLAGGLEAKGRSGGLEVLAGVGFKDNGGWACAQAARLLYGSLHHGLMAAMDAVKIA